MKKNLSIFLLLCNRMRLMKFVSFLSIRRENRSGQFTLSLGQWINSENRKNRIILFLSFIGVTFKISVSFSEIIYFLLSFVCMRAVFLLIWLKCLSWKKNSSQNHSSFQSCLIDSYYCKCVEISIHETSIMSSCYCKIVHVIVQEWSSNFSVSLTHHVLFV